MATRIMTLAFLAALVAGVAGPWLAITRRSPAHLALGWGIGLFFFSLSLVVHAHTVGYESVLFCPAIVMMPASAAITLCGHRSLRRRAASVETSPK